jgi:hypothetical protein
MARKLIYFVLISFTIFSILLFAFAYEPTRAIIISSYNVTRPLLLSGGGEGCLIHLKAKGVRFEPQGDQGTKNCPILNAVKVFSFADTKMSSPFTLSCPTAIKTAEWLEAIGARSITHMGTVNCRKRRGRNISSEHSYGVALDISAIDGASVQRDWSSPSKDGNKVREAATKACDYFNNVLTPDSNTLHYDHLHLDTGMGLGCPLNRFTYSAIKLGRLILKGIKI